MMAGEPYIAEVPLVLSRDISGERKTLDGSMKRADWRQMACQDSNEWLDSAVT